MSRLMFVDKSRRFIVRVGCLTVLLALAIPRAATASPAELFGFGGRSPALAGTGVADATDYDAVYINPAGLAEVDGLRVTVGGLFGEFSLDINGNDVGVDRPRGFIAGFAVPVPLQGRWKNRVGAALAFFVPGNVINAAHSPFVGDPVFTRLEHKTKIVAMQGGLAFKLTPQWRVGVGVWVLAGLGGGIHISTDPSGRFATRSEQQLQTNYVPMVGARYHMSDELQLGLVFRGVAAATYDITITNELADSLPLTIPTVQIAGTAQYDPMTLALEAAWSATPSLKLLGQLQYQRWSAYPPPTLKVVEAMPPAIQPGFHDTVVPRIAAEWTHASGSAILALRAGYFLAMTPAPEMDGRLSLFDNHRHVATGGFGFSLPGSALPLHVNAWAQAHFLMARRHTKDLDQFGPGEVLPFFTVKTGGRLIVGGVTVGVDL